MGRGEDRKSAREAEEAGVHNRLGLRGSTQLGGREPASSA